MFAFRGIRRNLLAKWCFDILWKESYFHNWRHSVIERWILLYCSTFARLYMPIYQTVRWGNKYVTTWRFFKAICKLKTASEDDQKIWKNLSDYKFDEDSLLSSKNSISMIKTFVVSMFHTSSIQVIQRMENCWKWRVTFTNFINIRKTMLLYRPNIKSM